VVRGSARKPRHRFDAGQFRGRLLVPAIKGPPRASAPVPRSARTAEVGFQHLTPEVPNLHARFFSIAELTPQLLPFCGEMNPVIDIEIFSKQRGVNSTATCGCWADSASVASQIFLAQSRLTLHR